MARNRYKPEEIVMNLCPSRCLGTRSLRLCITGNCRMNRPGFVGGHFV